MYEEWGNFWDPDNSQREIFESVCKVYKRFIGEVKEYDKKIEELEKYGLFPPRLSWLLQ